MILSQVTLWLVPPPSVSAKLKTNIVELCESNNGSPPFMPHVTLVGGIPCESKEELEELTNILRKGIEGKGGVPCRFRRELEVMYNPDDTLVWNQACVSVVKRDAEFMAFHKRVLTLLGLEDEEWEFPAPLREPHLSHFYGKEVPPPLEDVMRSPDFVATEAALWETSGGYEGVKNWKELTRIKLD